MSVEEEVLRIHKKMSKMTSSGSVSCYTLDRKLMKNFARLEYTEKNIKNVIFLY